MRESNYCSACTKKNRYSYQKPEIRAIERNMDAVKEWMNDKFPEIIQEAEKTGAMIYFEDETSVRQNVMAGKTWAQKGKTPIIHRSGQRIGYTLAGALGNNGKLYRQVFEGGMNADRYIEFLKGLLRSTRKPVILIHDGLPAHRAVKVKKFLESKSGKIKCYQLPGYSPDLNPIEFLWSMLKKFLGSRIQKSRVKLYEQTLNFFAQISDLKALALRLIGNIYEKLSTPCMSL